jgi:hypothetical protein
MPKVTLVALMCVAVFVNGCSSSPARSPKPSTTASLSPSPTVQLTTGTLDCQGSIGNTPPTADWVVVDGAVTVPSPHRPALGTGGYVTDGGVRRLFAKYGLVVRTGERTVLTVSDPAHVAIGWGSPASPVARFVVPACPRPDSDAVWLDFPGGFFVTRQACISLLVTHKATRHVVRIGVGTPCPGQGPPRIPAPIATP